MISIPRTTKAGCDAASRLCVSQSQTIAAPDRPGAGRAEIAVDAVEIVASLPEHGGSSDRAIRAYWQRDGEDDWKDEGQIDTIVRSPSLAH